MTRSSKRGGSALMVETLMVEGLVSEAREACRAILPFLSEGSRDYLQERVLDRLSTMERRVQRSDLE